MTSSTTSASWSYAVLFASRTWKYTSPFCTVARSMGCSGFRARARKRSSALVSMSAVSSLVSGMSMRDSSWEVRKPSKKCINGMLPFTAARCATAAMSAASWTLPELSWAKPVSRHAMTSEWSPKMLMAWVPTVRLATCSTPGRRSPAMR